MEEDVKSFLERLQNGEVSSVQVFAVVSIFIIFAITIIGFCFYVKYLLSHRKDKKELDTVKELIKAVETELYILSELQKREKK